MPPPKHLNRLVLPEPVTVQTLDLLLTMCGVLLPGSWAPKKEHFFGSALTGLGCVLKDKLATLAEEIAACLCCQRDVKGEEQMVNMLCLWSRQVQNLKLSIKQEKKYS